MDIGTLFVKYCLCLFNFAFVVSKNIRVHKDVHNELS